MPRRSEPRGWTARREVGLTALLLGSWVLAGCARPSRPPGGPEDRIPPMVVSTWPDTFATVEPTRDPIVIRFSERISERPTMGRLGDAVVVSPETGEYEVKSTRSGLEISLRGGLKEGLVYRVRVMNTIKDLFNNAMEGPFELVFSTGGDYENHVLAGLVTDRITGELVGFARVEAREAVEGAEEGEEDPDRPTYVAFTDDEGIYLLRYLPAADYEVRVYQDNNRNREPDFRERQGTTFAQLGLQASGADTLIQEISLLQPDTLPARLVRVAAQDSALLQLSFDDFLDPEISLEPVQVVLSSEEAEAPEIDRLIWQHQLDSLIAFQDSVRAADSLRIVEDSLTVVADSLQEVVAALQAAGDTVDLPDVERTLGRLLARLEPPEPEAPEAEVLLQPPPPILPQSVLYVLLRGGLEPNRTYQVTVGNVENINGLPGGGGEGNVTWEPPDPPPGDSTGVPLAVAPAGRGPPSRGKIPGGP